MEVGQDRATLTFSKSVRVAVVELKVLPRAQGYAGGRDGGMEGGRGERERGGRERE